ncbi:MAG: hypothetical protein R6X02_10715 [Enhygromyxa sp.]
MNDFDVYLDVEVVERVLGEFEWPESYEVEGDPPDGVIVTFPRSGFYLSQDYVGDVHLSFLPEHTGVNRNLGIPEAMLVLIPESERAPGPLTPGLIDDMSTAPSLAKTENELRDLFHILLMHLRPTLLGDFAWAEAYRR